MSVKETPTVCKHCNQVIRQANSHTMCKSKVEVLEILGRIKGSGWAYIQAGSTIVDLSNDKKHKGPYRANQHASRLTWFKLAEHGPERSGQYRITEKGLKFLQGRQRVPKHIWCKDGLLVDWSKDTYIRIDDVKGLSLDKSYWNNYGFLNGKLRRNK